MLGRIIPTLEWSGENVKKFWDFYSNYPELYFTYQYGARIVETLLPYINSNSRILDYGCGTGFLIDKLIGKDLKIYGIDLSPASVRTVNEKFKNATDFKGAWPNEDVVNNAEYVGFFDVVFLIEVVEHLDDENLKNVLASTKKLLRQGGKLIITTPNEEDLEASVVYCPESGKVFHRWQHVRSWSMKSLEEHVSAFGFKTEYMFTTDFAAQREEKFLRYYFGKLIGKLRSTRTNTSSGPHLVYIGNSI